VSNLRLRGVQLFVAFIATRLASRIATICRACDLLNSRNRLREDLWSMACYRDRNSRVPQLARRYPRDFTFYVADPISSVRVYDLAGNPINTRAKWPKIVNASPSVYLVKWA
jgi:hypothetical protein